MLRKNLLRTLEIERHMFGLTSLDLRNLAFELEESLKCPHKFNKDTKCAVRDWLFTFLKRNPVLIIQMNFASFLDNMLFYFFITTCVTSLQ